MSRNPRAIHETQLGDLIDMITSTTRNIKDNGISSLNIFRPSEDDKNDIRSPMYKSSSIMRADSNLTMVFPVLCSKSITVETASMISSSLEKRYATVLERLFASYQISDAGSVQEYIEKFHRNMGTRAANLDDVFKIMDAMNESTKMTDSEIRTVRDDMKNINFVLPSPVNEKSLSDYTVSGDKVSYNEGAASSGTSSKKPDDLPQGLPVDRIIKDTDYKKANDLMPTTLIINFKYNDGKNVTEVKTGLAAVKCKLYPIPSGEIIQHLADKTINNNWVTNFIRASTREISFVKDFLFAIDKAKIDALSASDRRKTTDRMWKILERRATGSKANKIMRKGGAESTAAITTLVISQEEVEYLNKHYGVDLERLGMILKLFNSYSFMGIVIVDEAMEVAKFIFDSNEPVWDTLSFTHLERESSDSTYKRVINLMSKIS